MSSGPWAKKKPDEERRNRSITVRFTSSQYQVLSDLAKAEGRLLAHWAGDLLYAVALRSTEPVSCTESGQPHPADTAAG